MSWREDYCESKVLDRERQLNVGCGKEQFWFCPYSPPSVVCVLLGVMRNKTTGSVY